jgi:hypothetical protein
MQNQKNGRREKIPAFVRSDGEPDVNPHVDPSPADGQEDISQHEGNGVRKNARSRTRVTKRRANASQTGFRPISRGGVVICSHGNISERYFARSIGIVPSSASGSSGRSKARLQSRHISPSAATLARQTLQEIPSGCWFIRYNATAAGHWQIGGGFRVRGSARSREALPAPGGGGQGSLSAFS